MCSVCGGANDQPLQLLLLLSKQAPEPHTPQMRKACDAIMADGGKSADVRMQVYDRGTSIARGNSAEGNLHCEGASTARHAR